MENLSSAGVTVMYALTVLSVIIMMICIGKFFYKTPFRQIYDFINTDDNDDSVCLIAFFAIPVACMVAWIGCIIGVFPIMMVGLVGGAFVSAICLLVFFVCGTISVVVPYMQDLHRRIVNKHENRE